MSKLYLFEPQRLEEILQRDSQINADLLLEVLTGNEIYAGFMSDEAEKNENPIYNVSGDIANIDINGDLVNKKSFFAWLFGGDQTTYYSIQDALEKAANDNAVKKIYLNIDSPGGHVNGCAETAQMIRNMDKSVIAYVSDCCSAAYWLASQANKIYAISETARIGSIGITTTILDDSELLKKEGFKRYIITSNDAPKKWDDITKKEVRDDIQAISNDIHEVFVRHVAEGRNTSTDDVNENYGQGGCLLAEKAEKAGMIDGIVEAKINTTGDSFMSSINFSSINPNNETGEENKNVQQLTDDDVKENPYPGEHSLRMKNPGSFANNPVWKKGYKAKFLRVNDDPAKLKPGKKPVDKIIGKLKGKSGRDDPSVAQAYRFRTKYWTIDQVRAWIKDKGWVKGEDYISLEPAKKEEQKSSASGAKNITGGIKMTLDEFKTNNQELYASVLEEGKEIGAEREKKRVSELLSWSSQHPQCSELVNEAIINGKSAQNIMPGIMAKVMGGTNADAANDNPDDINGVDTTGSAAGGGNSTDQDFLNAAKIAQEKLKADMAQAQGV